MVICYTEYKLGNSNLEFSEIVTKNIQKVKAMSSILLYSKRNPATGRKIE
jgi:hypothetical protein